ncbi:MAG: HD domain-containing protein [Phycisphaerales bacterium]|nr:HD domain-containing protein [Phycisphaerales bacterium]
MKLIFCPRCQDVVRLIDQTRRCRCGQSGGRYTNGARAVYFGQAVPLGIINHALRTAIMRRTTTERTPFGAFVMPINKENFRASDDPITSAAVRQEDVSTALLVRAYMVAAKQHAGQTRKDAAKTPYINHPIQVANLLSTVAQVTDCQVLAAAVLHDVVEDTDMTLPQLAAEFGDRVAKFVAECTDDKSLPKAERKRLQIINAPHKSREAKLIKLADKITNVSDIVSADWPVERKLDYLAWARQVVAGLRGIHPELDAMFEEAIARAQKGVEMQAR